MPTSIDVLKTLAGGRRAYDPLGALELSGLREDRSDELAHNLELAADPRMHMMTGGTAGDLSRLNRDIETDPFTGAGERAKTEAILARQGEIQRYNSPEEKAIRDEQEANALRRLVLPTKVKGEYDVAAAREHAAAAAANTAAIIGGRERVANINQAGTTARTAAGLKSQALRQRYQAVATGKEKAPGTGFFGQFTGGNEAAKQKLLADIQAQIDASDLEDAASAPAEEAAPAAVPGGGNKAARMAALRAAMGR